MVIGGTPDMNSAAPGTTVTITFNPKYAETLGLPYPAKLKKWVTGAEYYDISSISWGYGDIPLPNLTFANATSPTTTFVMPDDGPAAIVAVLEECHHTGGTHMGQRLEPTCTGYGHEPDVLCNDCGSVMTEGARIAALGHVLNTEPIEGTVAPLYCTYKVTQYNADGTSTTTVTNPKGNGYAGDFYCNRCKKNVKGPSTPIVHRMHYTSIDKTGKESVTVFPYSVDYADDPQRLPTCTTDGLAQDTLCGAGCGKVIHHGRKISRLGHDWGDWEVIREATTRVKGMEQHVCNRDNSHKETRVTDYSGPDHRLKADKTKVNFEWTYGYSKAPITQTVTFTSVGRNEILSLKSVKNYRSPIKKVTLDGMTMTIEIDPRPKSTSTRTISLKEIVVTEEG